jgi:hypothetical protein
MSDKIATDWITTIESIDRVSGEIEFDVYGQTITLTEAKKTIRHFAKMKEFKTFIIALRITKKD